MEISMTTLIVSGVFVAFTYAVLIWAAWMGYKGINASAPPFHEGGHPVGNDETYDEHCMIGDTKCSDVRRAKAA